VTAGHDRVVGKTSWVIPGFPVAVLNASHCFSRVRNAHPAMGILDTSCGLGDCHKQPAQGKCARCAHTNEQRLLEETASE